MIRECQGIEHHQFDARNFINPPCPFCGAPCAPVRAYMPDQPQRGVVEIRTGAHKRRGGAVLR